jgi:hypothetical protein
MKKSGKPFHGLIGASTFLNGMYLQASCHVERVLTRKLQESYRSLEPPESHQEAPQSQTLGS